MIPLKLQLFLLVLSVGGLVVLVRLIVKYRLELKYSLLWIVLSVTTVVLAVVPQFTVWLTTILGIEKPVNLVFLFGIVLSLMIMFSLTVALSSSSYKIREMAQEIGLLKHELHELKGRIGESDRAETKESLNGNAMGNGARRSDVEFSADGRNEARLEIGRKARQGD